MIFYYSVRGLESASPESQAKQSTAGKTKLNLHSSLNKIRSNNRAATNNPIKDTNCHIIIICHSSALLFITMPLQILRIKLRTKHVVAS